MSGVDEPEAEEDGGVPAPTLLGEVASGSPEADASDVGGDFDKATWEVSEHKYGLSGLIRMREAMMPIEKCPETAHLKFLIVPGASDAPDAVGDASETRESRDLRRGGERPERKGQGRGKGKESKGGRYVPDMGRTETLPMTRPGQWWRNCTDPGLDVIVREDLSLSSPDLFKVPPGHYVQQSGKCEVFVSGKATGLLRMPVAPRGWVTVDATQVRGPKYLEQVRTPSWKVIFQSGSTKGDIVVREGRLLESPEVAVLLYGTVVQQAGPQEVLEDGIVRMPIVFPEAEREGPDMSGGSRKPYLRTGWVTCDATSQGGPRFFEPVSAELKCAAQAVPTATAAGGASSVASDAAAAAGGSWDKNRMWKVVNLQQRSLPLVSRAEPFAPGTSHAPLDDIVVRWLSDGDVVEQVGHSKKMRGYMVMPVRLEGGGSEGFVTRRLVDKTRDGPEDVWFVELRNGVEAERSDRRRPQQHRRQGGSYDA